ncbi:MAG: PhoH family protein [Nitrospinota bacterium]|nr:PhoH family protein [Nitrospinota bacterium]
MKKSITETIQIADPEAQRLILGNLDQHLNFIEKSFNVEITGRGDSLSITGKEKDAAAAKVAIASLANLMADGFLRRNGDLKSMITLVKDNPDVDPREIFAEKHRIQTEKKTIMPKGVTQKEYILSIKQHDMVFGIGPAGTGKTYLAVAMAVSAMLKNIVKKIILVRPALEAGERLGFLPGDLYEKVTPYMQPLYDALYDMFDPEKVAKMIADKTIEIAPLAYMRGRTLNDAFIILDEAQNCTSEQMKMFLTRLGTNSKAVITGDITQIDLPLNVSSGLIEAGNILKDIEGISFIYFKEGDVVRHSLVKAIIKAYSLANQDKRK